MSHPGRTARLVPSAVDGARGSPVRRRSCTAPGPPPPRSRPLPAGPGLAGPLAAPGTVRASARRDPAVFPKDRRDRGKGSGPGPVGGPARRRARSRRPRDHRGERFRIARTPPPRAPVPFRLAALFHRPRAQCTLPAHSRNRAPAPRTGKSAGRGRERRA
ncbi:hypothetical protein GCM10009605_59370 [Nocardiopsis composta]